MTFLKYANKGGFPCVESTGISSNGSGTTSITFNSHPFINGRFFGGFWVKIAQTLATGSDVINFNVFGTGETPLYLPTGDQATAANLVSAGNAVHLVFFDRDNNRLTLIA